MKDKHQSTIKRKLQSQLLVFVFQVFFEQSSVKSFQKNVLEKRRQTKQDDLSYKMFRLFSKLLMKYYLLDACSTIEEERNSDLFCRLESKLK